MNRKSLLEKYADEALDIKNRIDVANAVSKMEYAATNKYNELFNNELYKAATKGRSVAYNNRLIDYALALCGHHHYSFNSSTRLSHAAWAFLAEFVRE